MVKRVRDAELESATKRAKLKPRYPAYYRSIEGGLHIGYRASTKGGRWVARWYLDGGHYRHVTLDEIPDGEPAVTGATSFSYDQAVTRVRELFLAARTPAVAKGPLTVKEVCTAYVQYLRTHKKTGDDAEQRIAKHILPKLGDLLVSDLTKSQLEDWLRGLVRRAPDDPEIERRSKDTANRLLTNLKAALNRAFQDTDNGIATDAAWRRVKPFAKVGRAREVFLDQTEAKRLINSCSGAFRDLVTAALLTGARPPHELASVRVRDFRVDRQKGQADLGTLAVNGKTGPREIILTQEAIKFFTAKAARREPDALLLPKDDGSAWGKNHHIRPMRDAVVKAKLPKDCTIYALRHSHASQALLGGMNQQLLAENMGTSVAMLEKHYGKFTKRDRRQLIEASSLNLGLKLRKVAARGAREEAR